MNQEIETLPSLIVEIEGSVKSTNLATYKDAVEARIAAINTDLRTDEDFADAEQMVKFLSDSEKELDSVKARALAQTATIDDLFRAIDSMRESARSKRLELDRLVKARKESVRYEIKAEAEQKFADHLDAINATLGGKITLESAAINPQFAAVMKGKKTVFSLRSACDDELDRCKIEASAIADKIRANLEILRSEAAGFERLFRDVQTILHKNTDDLRNLIAARIAEHKAEEERIAESARKRERERIEREQAAEAKRAEEAARKAAKPAEIPAEPASTPHTKPNAKPAAPQITLQSIIKLVAHAYGLSNDEAESTIRNLVSQKESA